MSLELTVQDVLDMIGRDLVQGQRSLSGAVALSLLAILMLVGSSVAATVAPDPFFMLPWRRAESGRPAVNTNCYKGWSGRKVPSGPGDERTIVSMVYFHEQTIAVVELGKKKTLRNCELIEVCEPVEVSDALRNLSSLGKPFEISFEDMMGLMEQCHELHMPVLENVTSPNKLRARSAQSQQPPPARSSLRSRLQQQRGLLSNTVGNPFSIFNGIVPGTKWCGTGDIASTYYDLGSEQALDRCCRTHDLCPVKVRPFQTRYNLTNAAIFSKSHCECDDALFRCLKNARSATADVLGNIYFNIVQVPCLEHVLPPAPPTGVQGVEPMRFTPQHFSY